LAGVAQYPARVKCALLAWMAWKDAAIQAGAEGQPKADISRESNKEQN
jgi:nitrogen fixation NifU-like protein